MPVYRMPGGKVRLKLDTQVHHIKPKRRYRRSKLQAINKDCHMRETFADQGKIFKSKVTIGIDRWPT